jgi:hypothetical protein
VGFTFDEPGGKFVGKCVSPINHGQNEYMRMRVAWIALFVLYISLGSSAQSIFVYKDKTKKVVEVLEDKGNVYFYCDWNDSLHIKRAVIKDNLTEVIQVNKESIDSVLLSMNNQRVADSIDIVIEENKELRFFVIPSAATSFRMDQFNFNLSSSFAALVDGVDLFGGGIGYERMNKGRSFIVTNSVLLRLFYHRFFTINSGNKKGYCGAEFSVGKTLGGNYNNAWNKDNISDITKMNKEHLGNFVGVKLLIGIELKGRFLFDIGLLNRDLGIIFPDDPKRYMLAEVRLGYKI